MLKETNPLTNIFQSFNMNFVEPSNLMHSSLNCTWFGCKALPYSFDSVAIQIKSGCLNTMRPRHNGRHFADDVFKCIFLNEKVLISIKISQNLVLKCSINHIPALVQIMAWRRPGDKPLSEPMMVKILTHICFTRPQWVDIYQSTLWFCMCLQCMPLRKSGLYLQY